MWKAGLLRTLGLIALIAIATLGVARADTVVQVGSSAAQAANDSLDWSQKGADGTILAASFSAQTALSNNATVSLGAANSVISTVCSVNPCSWTGGGFTPGDSLLWTSDAGNGGSGPVTINFTTPVAGAGALIQSDLPGPFTGQIQVYNGATLLASYTASSNSAGDPVYLGALDQTGPNITSVVFSLTTCASLCSDFGLDEVSVNELIPPSLTAPTGAAALSGLTSFTWNPGAGWTSLRLKVGILSPGLGDLEDTGNVDPSVTSVDVNIPANGATLYVRLAYSLNGVPQHIDYRFTEAGVPTPPTLTAPTGSGSLSGSTLFTWNPGAGVPKFRFKVGTTAPGSSDLFDSGNVFATVTSETVNITASPVYVQLAYLEEGTWKRKQYTFGASAPALTSPSGPGKLSGVTPFTWSPGVGSTQFRLKVGTTGRGSSDLYDSGSIPSSTTTESVTIPANGARIYVRLAYLLNGVWTAIDYTFTEVGP